MLNHTLEEVKQIKEFVNKTLGSGFDVVPYYDGSLILLFEGEQVTSEEVYLELKNNTPLDVEVFINGIITLYSERVAELITITSSPGHYIIADEDDLLRLQRLMCMQGSSLDSLSTAYHKLTGKEVIDRRDSSEYTNVDAQDDPDFWAEESINDKVQYKCS